MKPKKPYNLRLKSFVSIDDAVDLCALLQQETGVEYTVADDSALGFTAHRCQPAKAIEAASPVRIPPALPQARAVRQALRGFLKHYLQIAFGAFVIFYTYHLMRLAFMLLELHEIPYWLHLTACAQGIKVFGLLTVGYGLRFLYSFYAKTLLFSEDGMILKKGLIAQDQVLIRFADIKSLSVKQSIMGRLLGIGSLYLDSAATNGDVDIVFDNIDNPIAMRNRIQQLIDYHTQGHR